MTVILRGIVGSVAYGLAHDDSDVDRLGVFVAPTAEFLGLSKPTESVVTNDPDMTLHEAGKWCRLALGCNPTVLEAVWLPDHLYEVRTPAGDSLIDSRHWFAHARGVRNSYLGYASQQFRKLEARADGSFSADTRKRTSKHARHLARLIQQGFTFYSTGQLPIRVGDPEALRDFGDRVAAGDIDAARAMMAKAEDDFDRTAPALRAEPNTAAVNAWLVHVRREHLAAA